MQDVDGWLEDTYPTHSTTGRDVACQPPEMVVMVVHSFIIRGDQIDIRLPVLLPQEPKNKQGINIQASRHRDT